MVVGGSLEAWMVAGVLFAIAGLEAMPSYGRAVPGHLALATVSAIAVALGILSPLFVLAPVAGAILSDVGAYAWIRLRPLRGVWRGGSWWKAGLDVDDLSGELHRTPLKAAVAAKFSTRERARLPYAAAKAGIGAGEFATLAIVASSVWAPAWILAGAVIGGITLLLPSEGDFVVLAIGLVTLATLVSRPVQAQEA